MHLGQTVPISHDNLSLKNESLAKNDFQISRGLGDYSELLPVGHTTTLKQEVMSLQSGSTWIDMGAGRARALIEGLVINPKISNGIGIAYKKPENVYDSSAVIDRFSYLDGAFVEIMAKDGRFNHLLAKVDLITDMYGPLSYTDDLATVLQTYLNLLKVGGTVYFNIMVDRNFEKADTANGKRITQLWQTVNTFELDKSAHQENLLNWLATIEGVEIVSVKLARLAEVQVGTDLEFIERAFAIKLKKNAAKVQITKKLTLQTYDSATPPARRFKIELPK